MILEAIIFAGALAGAATSGAVVALQFKQARQRLTPEQYDELAPKGRPSALPEYSKGGGSYRDAAAQSRCEVCKRTCLHCKKDKRRRERRK